MRVVVLGSKPGEEVVDGDVLYFANGGFLAHPQAVAAAPRTVAVLSAGAFTACLLPGGPATAEARALFDGLARVAPARVIVTASERHAAAVTEFVRQRFGSAEREVLSPQARDQILAQVTGLPGALLPEDFFRLGAGDLVHHLEQLAAAYRLRQRGAFVDVPHFFRPSTGVFALACAIREHGPRADYVLCGIGVKGRGVHGYHAGANATAGPDHGLRPHVEADIQVLRALSRKFRIGSTNAELCDVCGLQETEARETHDH